MSLRATAWAWTVPVQPTAKLVLVALADHADEVGLCWPSVARLRTYTGLSERAIRGALRDLETAGVIITDAREGHVSRYRLTISGGVPPRQEMPGLGENTPAPNAGVVSDTPAADAGEGGSTCRGGGQEMPGTPAADAPEPSRTVIEPSGNRQSARGARLPADWWPASADQTFARDLGLDPVIIADSFRDYWHGRPGAGGVKLDWSATWRNWCRKDAERKPAARQPESKIAWAMDHPMFNGGRHAEPDRDCGPVAPFPAPARLRSV